MNKKKLGAAGLATAALTLLALAAPVAAFADSSVPPAVGTGATQTDQALYVLDPEEGTPLTQGSSVAWGLQLLGGPSATDPLAEFTAPAGAAQWYTFISPRGSERNYSAWNGYLYQGASGAVSLAAISPANLATTGTGTPAGAAAVAAAGGDWSLGVAWTNGSNVLKVAYTYITITPGTPSTATYTFAQPASVVTTAPALTTQPSSQSAVVGGDVTFTAAASGTPTPTVQWQSAPVATSTFTDIAGATSNTLTVSDAQLAITGTQYRAVYTNSAGSATSNVAVLTVTPAAVEEPVSGDAGELPHVDLADGETSLVLDNTGIAAGTYGVWAWSTPTQLPNATVDASGDVTIDLSGLSTGTHTVALVDIATNDVVAWLTVTLSSTTETATDLTVDVTTSNKFALEGVAAAIDLGSAARGGTTSADLPAFTVTDDRDSLPGWDLTSKVDDFVNDGVAVPANAGDVIDKGALSIEPRKVGPAVTGISAKTLFTAGASNLFAEGLLNSVTPSTGTQFDAELTFNVPATAKKGTYTSKLTLTLTSK